MKLKIDADIGRAQTLPAAFYTDEETWQVVRERIFARHWQWAAPASALGAPGATHPFTLLPGLLDEPLLLTYDADHVYCLSNVCTHRANLVEVTGGVRRELRCGYHGRRFGLD
ncbi:MAG: Rieske 2Fe-2S domain-containing protein, partial [Catalinimonas sp.]